MQPLILLVEDELLVRDMIAEELRDAGYLVIECANSDEALVQLERVPEIDLLFTDIRMPGPIDGFALAERVRSRYANLPVLYTTGFYGSEPRQVSESLMLRKPYRPKVALRLIVDLLAKRNRVAGSPG